MYCSHCGRQMEPGARFCSACGATFQPYDVPRVRGPLLRPRDGRMIAGVCAAIALAYGWDTSVVRIVASVLLLFSGGTVGLVYFLLWIIIPEAPYSLPGRTGTIA